MLTNRKLCGHALAAILLLLGSIHPVLAAEPEKDPATNLIKAEYWELVSANCMGCHSTKGFTQVRQNRKNWEKPFAPCNKSTAFGHSATWSPKCSTTWKKLRSARPAL